MLNDQENLLLKLEEEKKLSNKRRGRGEDIEKKNNEGDEEK